MAEMKATTGPNRIRYYDCPGCDGWGAFRKWVNGRFVGEYYDCCYCDGTGRLAWRLRVRRWFLLKLGCGTCGDGMTVSLSVILRVWLLRIVYWE